MRQLRGEVEQLQSAIDTRIATARKDAAAELQTSNWQPGQPRRDTMMIEAIRQKQTFNDGAMAEAGQGDSFLDSVYGCT